MTVRAANIVTWPLRHPVAIALISLCVAALAALASSRMRADASLAAMFSRNNPSAEALIRVMNDFGAVDELLVLVSVPGAGADASLAPDVARLEKFGERLTAELARAPRTRDLIDGAFYQPDADSHAYFEKVLGPAAMYYLDDASFAAARNRLTLPEMRAQIRQDEAMMTAPGAAGSMAKALMQDPLRLRDFLAPVVHRLQAQKPFGGREGTDAFVSPDGRNLLVRVRGKKSPSDLEFCKELTRAVADVAERVNDDHLELRYAGSYAIAAASATAIKSDMISSVMGSVICLQVLFVLAYRSPFKLFALAFGPIALGLLLGFGGYALCRIGLTPMTAVLGGILAGMAIDYSIQYLAMYESQRDGGATPRIAAEASAVGITPAAFAAWATSVVGFLAIGASSVKALRDFALLGTLGLTGAFLAKMALLPLLLMLTDRRKTAPAMRSRFRLPLEPLLRWIGRRTLPLIWTSAGVFVAALCILLFLPGEILPLESDLTIMHPRPNPALDAQNLISKRFGMHDWLIVHLHANSPEDLIALAHRVDHRLQSRPAVDAGVAGSFSLANLLPDPATAAARHASITPAEAQRVVTDFRAVIQESAFNPDAREIRDYEKGLHALLTRMPPSIDALIPYRRLAEMLLPRSALIGKDSGFGVQGSGPEAPASAHLNPEPGTLNPLSPVTEAITLVFIGGSTDHRAARDRAVEGIRAALDGETGATVTGMSVLSYDTERNVRRDLPRLSFLAIVIVMLYLLIHFRNLKEAVLTMLPTVFSLVVLLAAMRLAAQKVNMVNLIAAPLLIGIDVDYGIFLVALARIRKAGDESREALIARIAPVCHAVVVCAVATIIGYGTLVWTSVPAIRSLGFAVAVGIGACLFCVLFLLTPAMLQMSAKSAPSRDATLPM